MWKWGATLKTKGNEIENDPRNGISSGKFTMSFVKTSDCTFIIWHMVGQTKRLFSQNSDTKWYDNYDINRKSYHVYICHFFLSHFSGITK